MRRTCHRYTFTLQLRNPGVGRARGTTASKMIREAIDEYLADDDEALRLARFRAAVDRIAANPIKRLPPGSEYVEELRRPDRIRDEELEKRWRG